MSWFDDGYDYWPKYLDFPGELGRAPGPVPNASSINWPQAQLAPSWLPSGSPSFQPYRYTDGPIERPRLVYRVPNALRRAGVPMFRARLNQDASTDAVVSQVLDAPASVSTEAAVASAAPEASIAAPVAPVSSDEQAAAIASSPPPFVAFGPELLDGVKPERQERLARLEQTLTKLSAVSRGPALEAVYQRLLRLHDSIETKLEKRQERKARFKGFGRLRRLRDRLRDRKTKKVLVKHLVGQPGHDLKQLHAVREAYQTGKIDRSEAVRLGKLAIKT